MRDLVAPREAIEIVKYFEGFHRVVKGAVPPQAVPYLCPANFWTIGYGHLCPQDHPAINDEQAEWFLMSDLREAMRGALRCCPVLVDESDVRLAAIVDFCFNLGATRLAASTLRKRVNDRDWTRAAEELKRWVWGGGRKLPGLVLRRAAEADLLR